MARVLPEPEEYAELIPAPSSPVWRYASDSRMLAVAGYALMLQVAHPTVGAGVAEHSTFRDDPWGRLNRTLDYVNGSIYGGPELAGEIGRRVRAMHQQIKGVRPDGERYHALEPRAYAWVHATLAQAVFVGHERFGREMSVAVRSAYWRDWVRVGRLIGVREQDLPSDYADFDAYVRSMISEDLVANPAVDLVLETIARPKPPLAVMPEAVWAFARVPASYVLRSTTVGTLSSELRLKLGLPWSAADQRAYRAIAAASRSASPVVRGPLAVFGPTYVRLRARQLARGDVAREVPVRLSAVA